jgi:TPR repeat protein
MAPQRWRWPFAPAARAALVLALSIGAVACGRVVGQRPGAGWTPAQVALERRCQEGAGAACGQLGKELVTSHRDGDPARGLVLLEIACGLEDISACTTMGTLYGTQFSDGTSARARARDLLSRPCQQGAAAACTGLGIIARRDETDGSKAKQWFSSGCRLGDAEGCEQLGLVETDDLSGSEERAAEAFTLACRMGRLSACRHLALLEMANAGTRAEGLALLVGTCDRGHAPSCLSAALTLAPTTSTDPDCPRAAALGARACQGREWNGCAVVEACRLSSLDGHDLAIENLQRACGRKVGLACIYWADSQTDSVENSEKRRSAYRTACEGDTVDRIKGIACGRLAALDLARAATRTDKDRARHRLDEACEQSSGQACCDLAEDYRKRTDREASPARAAELRARACRLHERRCCDLVSSPK